MAIDPAAIGRKLSPVTMDIERGRLRFFAAATGQADPVYTDVAAARAAGHRDLPVPPSFLFCVEMEQPEPFGFMTELGADTRHMLHGEQAFTYHHVAYAGDRLVAWPHIADIYTRKSGTLEFVVKETEVATADGAPIADLRMVLVVREPRPVV